MRGVLVKRTDQYIQSLIPPRGAVLREMERYAAQHNVPIIGPACGRVLYQLARMIRARRVFEMGSAIGYSTIWLARAVGPGGTVYYTDSNPENARRAEANFRRAGVRGRIRILIGDALASLRSTPGEFDVIFNDVNKTQYPKVLRLAVPRVREGGLLVTDNVLWSGRVTKPLRKGDASTPAIQRFNQLIYRSRNLFTTIIPLRDGFAVCLKNRDKS